jgi:predicted DsbA family dithiol-disulfide isomerase
MIQVYSSIECPYAYLATYRLRRLRDESQERFQVVWRALSLEYINRQSYSKPLFDAEYDLFRRIEPDLAWTQWNKPDWQWPTTFLPAFEALACAQEQSPQAAFEMSWALRYAHFAEHRNLSLRSELFEIARPLSEQGWLDFERFKTGWDSGRFRKTVLDESRRGWRELKLDGSATLITNDGRRVTNPAVGEIDFDEEAAVLRGHRPFEGDAMEEYRRLVGESS